MREKVLQKRQVTHGDRTVLIQPFPVMERIGSIGEYWQPMQTECHAVPGDGHSFWDAGGGLGFARTYAWPKLDRRSITRSTSLRSRIKKQGQAWVDDPALAERRLIVLLERTGMPRWISRQYLVPFSTAAPFRTRFFLSWAPSFS